MAQPNRAEAIIVGAGVIGASCAFHLARRGVRNILVLEKSHLAAGASGATAGMVGASGGVPECLNALVVESERLIHEAIAEFDQPPEVTTGGAMITAVSQRGLKNLHVISARNQALGIESQVLEGDEARRLEPLLSHEVTGILFRPTSFHVNPFRLCQGYLGYAIRHGAKVRYGVAVRDVRTAADRIDRVVTDQGEFECDWLINAAGANSPDIMASSGWHVPVEPGRGQIIITEATPPMTPHLINTPDHLYVRQTAPGNFLIGSRTEKVGFDGRITLDKIAEYARGLVRIVPMLARLQIIRFYCGFRPLSPDDLPIIGPLPDCRSFLLATGHTRSGVIYSAVTGKLIAEIIVDGRTHVPIEPFSIARFAANQGGQP